RSAERHAWESLTINRKSGNRFGEAMNLETLGKIYERLRDLPGAQEALENSLIILDEVDRGFDKAKVYNDLADTYLSFWRYEEAERCYQKAQQIKVEAGDNYGLAFIYANFGNLSLKRNDVQAALKYFTTSLNLFQQFKDRQNTAKVFRNIGIVHEHLNDLAG